jgi:hypothetical protein
MLERRHSDSRSSDDGNNEPSDTDASPVVAPTEKAVPTAKKTVGKKR